MKRHFRSGLATRGWWHMWKSFGSKRRAKIDVPNWSYMSMVLHSRITSVIMPLDDWSHVRYRSSDIIAMTRSFFITTASIPESCLFTYEPAASILSELCTFFFFKCFWARLYTWHTKIFFLYHLVADNNFVWCKKSLKTSRYTMFVFKSFCDCILFVKCWWFFFKFINNLSC